MIALRRAARCLAAAMLVVCGLRAHAQDAALPELTQPVNDFAHVIDRDSAARMDAMIRGLQTKTGDTVVVAAVQTIAPYGDIAEYEVKLFENHGRGIGARGKDNGVLILLAMKERSVRIEVGYDLEQWITDGFAGETSRDFMRPLFREGRYGEGLLAGTSRVIGRIAQARNVTIDGVRAPAAVRRPPGGGGPLPLWAILVFFIFVMIASRLGGGGRRTRYWGGGPWSGWSSGVGPFGGGGGWSSGGGGGFGGGFGGFGGGRSGGGGGGASW